MSLTDGCLGYLKKIVFSCKLRCVTDHWNQWGARSAAVLKRGVHETMGSSHWIFKHLRMDQPQTTSHSPYAVEMKQRSFYVSDLEGGNDSFFLKRPKRPKRPPIVCLFFTEGHLKSFKLYFFENHTTSQQIILRWWVNKNLSVPQKILYFVDFPAFLLIVDHLMAPIPPTSRGHQTSTGTPPDRSIETCWELSDDPGWMVIHLEFRWMQR